ncbi:hypothetical protein LCGC14_0365530 [marine sediment metagenome]|uniref:Uncharacterized protein n=1 Tax=marine sediment metagenome TaxID=412755 RepID=A0A0F9TPL9_9ZZZZ
MPTTHRWAQRFYNTITVGKDAAGHDVKFFGDTSGSYWLWDASANAMVLANVDIAIDQGQYIYLDGDQGGEYITSDVANYLMLNGTYGLSLAIAGTDEVYVTGTAVTIATNDVTLSAGDLTLTAGNASVVEGAIIYLAGQDSTEYLTSDATGYSMLNGLTGVNLAVGGTDEVAVSASAVTLATNNLTLTLGELALGAGNASVVQGAVIYLDAQDGAEYLTSDTTDEATLNATTAVNISIGGTDEVAVSSSAVTLGSNNLTLTLGELALGAGNASVVQGAVIYLDGQDGGEYLYSPTASEATLNATTEVNLAVSGTTEVAIGATTVTIGSNNLVLSTGSVAIAQGQYIYLDGDQGGEYLTSDVADYAMLNGTTGVNLAVAGTDEVAITASAVTLASNNLTLTLGELALGAGNASIVQGAVIYLDGQDGGEYLTSDAVGYAMVNGTTGVNVAIAGVDKILVTANTTTLTNDLTMTAGEFVIGAPVKMLITDKAVDTKYLTVAEAGVITASTDGIYLYLPTYVGNEGTTYFIKATDSHTYGVYIFGYDATEFIDGANSKTSGAQYDLLGVIADSAGWHNISKIGTWS